MKSNQKTIVIICIFFLLGTGLLPPCHGADYAARKGLAFYRGDLSQLTKQTLALPASEKGQKETLNSLFQMKFNEAERLFEFCADSDQAKRQVAELYLFKAIESREVGNWIQAYSALKDAMTWNKVARQQRLQIGKRQIDIASFSKELEEEVRGKGGEVTFLIRKFPEEKMFHPDKVVLKQKDEGVSQYAETTIPADTPDYIYPHIRTQWKQAKPTKEDEEFLMARFRQALYKYFYDPVNANTAFTLYLPNGEYGLYERGFAIKPEEFAVASKDIKVTLRPAAWFGLSFSDEVHPANISLSYKGEKVQDLNHVPFGHYRIHVDHRGFAYPVASVTFIHQNDNKRKNIEAMSYRPDAYVIVEDRGSCTLALQPRSIGQKIRHVFLGY